MSRPSRNQSLLRLTRRYDEMKPELDKNTQRRKHELETQIIELRVIIICYTEAMIYNFWPKEQTKVVM